MGQSGGGGWRSSKAYSTARESRTASGDKKKALSMERDARLEEGLEKLATGERVDMGVNFQQRIPIDRSLALRKIDPYRVPDLEHGTLVLVDMTGSNRQIRQAVLSGARYLGANLLLVAPVQAAYGLSFGFFGDHTDGWERWYRDFGFIGTAEEDEDVLAASMDAVRVVQGGDYPECMSSALENALSADFGPIPVKNRHLVMVGDSVPHAFATGELRQLSRELGEDLADRGCPNCRSWGHVFPKVADNFRSFTFVACGGSPQLAALQRDLLKRGRKRAYEFIDLSHMGNSRLRLGIVLNVILFSIARGSAISGNTLEPIQSFFAALYEKWVSCPLPEFGARADESARETIMRFAPFIPARRKDVLNLMAYVFSIPKADVEELERKLHLRL